MTPGNHCHMQSVLENLHYGKKIRIINIRYAEGEKFIDYEVNSLSEVR